MTGTTNLVRGLHDQIVRCKDLIKCYEEISTGGFALMMLKPAVANAENALGGGDVVEMMRCYKELEGFE